MNKNKKFIVILGGGESGVGAAILAKKKKLNVFLSDSGIISNKYKKILIEKKIPFEEGKHTEEFIFKNAKMIIKSPGIFYKKNEFLKKIKYIGIPIISELEFASSYLKNNPYIIGITGSNGKTTTSSIIYKILKNNKNMEVGISGNIGFSFSRMVLQKKNFYILEISSFQLDDCEKMRLNIAVLLNITNDHLDKYDNKIENYIKSKFKIIKFQEKKDFFLYNYDDINIQNKLKKISSFKLPKCIPFSVKKKLKIGTYIKNNAIYFRNKKNEKETCLFKNINNIPLLGIHNLYNIMASITVCYILNTNIDLIKSSLLKLKPIKHRMEKIPYIINGVHFINDAKATNVDAVYYALECIKKFPIIWIAGGLDKGNDYSKIISLVKKKVKAIICLGKKNEKIVNFFKKKVNIILETKSIKKSILLSYKLSNPGDIILLSPACSSFDLFKNYKEKGSKFKKEVKNLFYHMKYNKK